MGAIPSTLTFCFSYCVCNTVGSLCNACFGGTTSTTGGRKRSVLLLSFAISLSLYFQYFFVPHLIQSLNHPSSTWWSFVGSYRSVPWLSHQIQKAWLGGYCAEKYDTNHLKDVHMFERCVGNVGVYRPNVIAFLFFLITAVITKFSSNNGYPSFASSAWPSKYGLYLLLISVSLFVPNEPFFNGWPYYAIFRFGAMIFILVQQVILIDMAYNWNEKWVDKAIECDAISWGSGTKWLRAIVTMCVLLYSSSIAGIFLLYHYFAHSGCVENSIVITTSWMGIILVTALQLYCAEGSLLTSSVISSYVVYLAYSIVSKHPKQVCNPTLGTNDAIGMTVGLFLTLLSLAWTGFSWTAEERLSSQGMPKTRAVSPLNPSRLDNLHHAAVELDLDVPFLGSDDDLPLSGGVVIDSTMIRTHNFSNFSSFVWKLNIILALVTCWVSASLTAWGYIESGVSSNGESTAANPQVGFVNMIMIGVSQCCVILLYAWTLVAPRIFPDYDFY